MDTPTLSNPVAPAAPTLPHNAVQEGIVRLRWPILVLAAVMLILGFNGRWRVGRDSALYRAVGENVAEGRGYTYRGERQKHIYPGMPYLLAGVEKVFGKQDAMRPWAAQGVMLGLGLLTLLAVYHLVRAHFPEWMAVSVTFGMAVNWHFLMHVHEIMSDVPFLLGVVLLLLGIAWVGRAEAGRGRRGAGVGLILMGAVLAMTMRPTFWALALALVGTSVLGMLRWPGRRWYQWGGLGALVVMVGLFVALDPRGVGGKYEEMVRRRVANLNEDFESAEGRRRWGERADKFLCDHLPDAVFGFEVPAPMGWVFSALVMGCALMVWKRSRLWGIYVLVTLGMTALMGSRPRYFLMILPMLLAGWALWADFVARLSARWFPRLPWMGSAVLLFWLSVATLPNLVRDVGLLLEQRSLVLGKGKMSFMEAYRNGRMKAVVDLAEGIRGHVPEGQRVLGIESRITTYLSGRYVYEVEEVRKGKKKGTLRRDLKKAGVGYIVYGPPGKRRSLAKFGTKMIEKKVVWVAPDSEVLAGELRIGRVMYPTPKKLQPEQRAKARARAKAKRNQAKGGEATTRATTRATTKGSTRTATQPAQKMKRGRVGSPR